MVKPAWMFKQSGVIPFRVVDDTIEVVLITSRSSGKWGIPKGIIERDLSPQDSAAKEAHEEAGVVGNVTDRVVAEYEYQKWGGTCKVQVFAMEAGAESEDCPAGRGDRIGQARTHRSPQTVSEYTIDRP
jgi:8-oxo-dGTP pyrophosphatase MutT (NUDIX family)